MEIQPYKWRTLIINITKDVERKVILSNSCRTDFFYAIIFAE